MVALCTCIVASIALICEQVYTVQGTHICRLYVMHAPELLQILSTYATRLQGIAGMHTHAHHLQADCCYTNASHKHHTECSGLSQMYQGKGKVQCRHSSRGHCTLETALDEVQALRAPTSCTYIRNTVDPLAAAPQVNTTLRIFTTPTNSSATGMSQCLTACREYQQGVAGIPPCNVWNWCNSTTGCTYALNATQNSIPLHTCLLGYSSSAAQNLPVAGVNLANAGYWSGDAHALLNFAHVIIVIDQRHTEQC